jgi:hypothetical protein
MKGLTGLTSVFILDLKVTNYVSALNNTISQCFMMRCVHAGKKITLRL